LGVAGDAHAALATLALKLNNGLVSIISTFLTGGKKKPDYARLTTLSEASRRDAIDALSQLSLRLSHSSLSLLLGGGGGGNNRRLIGGGADKEPKPKPKPKRSKSGEKKSEAGSNIRRIHAANVSAPQLAIIRPKPRRAASGGGGSRSPSAAPTPKSPPPPAHRRTQSAAAAPTLAALTAAAAGATPGHARAKSTPNPGPAAPPPPPPAPRAMSPAQQLLIAPPPSRAPHHHQYHHQATPAPHRRANNSGDGMPPPPPPPPRRRREQPTPSVYTFASDSTKVGEIPMARWAEPFDFEAMARLNAEAALRPPLNPAIVNGSGGRVTKRKGFFGLFRKTAPVEA
jgi:hypothetical protein